MNVLALGGCGEMGRHAVRTLAKTRLFGQITIADINEDHAKAAAARIGGGTRWKKTDITNSQQLDEALAEADLVINTVGPYYKFGQRVLGAAIKNKCHYLDICDDWEPTLEMLSFDSQAKAAGISAVIGMGATPGIANLLATRTFTELERIEGLYIGWNIESAVSEPPANGHRLERLKAPGYQPNSAVVHGVHQLTGKICVRRHGQFINEKPFKKIRIDYPGLGKGRAWTIGHPEPLTFPRYFPGIKNCFNLFVGPQKTVNQIRWLARLVNMRLLSTRRAAIMVEKDEIKHRRWEKDSLDWHYKTPRGERALPNLFAVACGTHAGRPARVASTLLSVPPGKMGGVTGIPLAIGGVLMAKGKITRKGVFAPEGGIDPRDFFNELAPLCAPARSDADDLLLITRSWENTLPDFFKNSLRTGRKE